MGLKSLQNDTRLTIHSVTKTSSNQYQSVLHFKTLSSTIDSGNYVCNVTVNSDSNYTYVTGSNSVTATISLTVTGIYTHIYYHNTHTYTHTHAYILS